MSFFDDVDPPPPAPEHVEYRSPPWFEAPATVMPVTVALDVLLARTPDWAVWVGGAAVTPSGITFTVTVLGRIGTLQPDAMAPLLDGEGAPRFGVGFADGRKAVAGDRRQHKRPPTGDAECEIALWPRNGNAGARRWAQAYWLWPLPPSGPLTFALSWPEVGIEATTVEVDTGPLHEAAARAVELWPDERPLPPESGSGWIGYA
jgi:hypothetical protein